ncbi:hypothetical protein BD779DRAFT_1472040 [Infundibulicybe gibba]|nr:hypothetical protein BD779DRAFT_1472040 [Infundibulicybe gibba]
MWARVFQPSSNASFLPPNPPSLSEDNYGNLMGSDFGLDVEPLSAGLSDYNGDLSSTISLMDQFCFNFPPEPFPNLSSAMAGLGYLDAVPPGAELVSSVSSESAMAGLGYLGAVSPGAEPVSSVSSELPLELSSAMTGLGHQNTSPDMLLNHALQTILSEPSAPSLPNLRYTAGGKPLCSNSHCHRQVLTSHCTNRMCKKHCIDSLGVCSSPGHRGQPRIAPPNGDPWAVSRPQPLIPLETVVAKPHSSALSRQSAAPRPALLVPPQTTASYRTPMTPAHEAQWVHLKQLQEANIAARKLSKDNERRLRDQVVIYIFCEDGVAPMKHREQDILTWPSFNLVQSPSLLKSMGVVDPQSKVEFYDPKLGCWSSEKIDHVMKVKDCCQLQELIDEYFPLPSMRGRKRKVSITDSLNTPSQIPRRDTIHTTARLPPVEGEQVTTSSAPSSNHHFDCSSNNSATSTPSAPQTFTQPSSPCPVIPNPSGGPHPAESWPNGLFACDVVAGFAHIANGKGQQERFHQAFPGAKWSKATFYRHQAVWKGVSPSERKALTHLPRTDEGSWITWYKSVSGRQKHAML